MAIGDLCYSKSVGDAGKLAYKTGGSGALIYSKPLEADLTSPTGFWRVGSKGGELLENREYSRSELQTIGLDAFAEASWATNEAWRGYISSCGWQSRFVDVGDPLFNYWESGVRLIVVCYQYDTSAYSGKTITECDLTVGDLSANGETMRVGVIASSSSTPGAASDWHEGGATLEVTANGTVTVSGSVVLSDYLYILRYCVGLTLPDSAGSNAIGPDGYTVTIRS